jgi:cation:H+ antiporter
MLMSFAAVVVGLAVLVWSADRFVDGAAAIAYRLGVSHLIVGITVIGFGTSAPEILVSIIAVLEDIPGIAIGNALGSNIANIGLILGVTAILAPVPVSRGLMRAEYPLLAFATVVLIACLYDLQLDRLEGMVLVGVLVFIMVLMIRMHIGGVDSDHSEEDSMSGLAAAIWVLVGLVLLVASSRLLVWGASHIAREFGVSDLVIGLTIIAVGTSLPELAASIASVRKSAPDMAVGNIIGSNLFNSLAVVGIPPLLGGFAIDSEVLTRDIPVMVGLTLALFLMSSLSRGDTVRLSWNKGVVLLGTFVVYQVYLYGEAMAGRAPALG